MTGPVATATWVAGLVMLLLAVWLFMAQWQAAEHWRRISEDRSIPLASRFDARARMTNAQGLMFGAAPIILAGFMIFIFGLANAVQAP